MANLKNFCQFVKLLSSVHYQIVILPKPGDKFIFTALNIRYATRRIEREAKACRLRKVGQNTKTMLSQDYKILTQTITCSPPIHY